MTSGHHAIATELSPESAVVVRIDSSIAQLRMIRNCVDE
jgi:hypothetical protein